MTTTPTRSQQVDGREPTLPFSDRLKIAHEVAGFLPTTKPELTETLGIISISEALGGASKHLAEVAVRQHKVGMSTPARTTRRIVHDYIDYGTDAANSWTRLLHLKDALDGVNPKLRLEVAEVTPITPGFLEFLRFIDLSDFEETDGQKKAGYDPFRVEYKPDNGGIVAFAELRTANWTVHDITRRLDAAVTDQEARHEFFLQRLEEIQKHTPSLALLARQGAVQVLNPPEVQ